MKLDWLEISRGQAPLLVSIPHTGLDLAGFEEKLASPWLARRDADWHIEQLYDFARELDATIVRTAISRTVIDVNRDPSGISLYPGQATTSFALPPPLMANRSTMRVMSQRQPTLASVAHTISIPITRPWPAR